MPVTSPTFVFDEDGKAYAYLSGKIVASGDDADELERKLAEFPFQKKKEDPDEDAPESQEEDEEPDHTSATHIKTPNGLKGTILGKQKGLWGDQITIRLENGRIAKFDVTPESKVEWLNEKTASIPASPWTALRTRLDETPDGTRKSLLARVKELKIIKQDATDLIRTANYDDEQTGDDIIVQADYELREISDALAALEEAEAYAPPAPFETGVTEQEQLGGNDSTWLENTIQDMVSESEEQDFDQLMDEGPELLVAEQETPSLEDAANVQEVADQFVSSKTAGMDKEATADFRKHFLARVEEVRRAELAARQERATIKRQASAEDNDGPAEGLFM